MVIFVAIAVALVAMGKLDAAYFDRLKRKMPRWLFLTISLGGLGLSLVVVGILAWSAFSTVRYR